MVNGSDIPEIKIIPPDEDSNSTDSGSGNPGPRHDEEPQLPVDRTKKHYRELDAPTWTFLSAMLGACGINDDWQNYVLFIRCASASNPKGIAQFLLLSHFTDVSSELTETIPNYAEHPLRIRSIRDLLEMCSEDTDDTPGPESGGVSVCYREADHFRSPIELARKKLARRTAHYEASRSALSSLNRRDNSTISLSSPNESVVSSLTFTIVEKEEGTCLGPCLSVEVCRSPLDGPGRFSKSKAGGLSRGVSLGTSYAIAILPFLARSRSNQGVSTVAM